MIYAHALSLQVLLLRHIFIHLSIQRMLRLVHSLIILAYFEYPLKHLLYIFLVVSFLFQVSLSFIHSLPAFRKLTH